MKKKTFIFLAITILFCSIALTGCSSSDDCPLCGGSGYYNKKYCPTCHGTGHY